MDPVLVGWKERLWEFQRGIPLLQQLASKALKVYKIASFPDIPTHSVHVQLIEKNCIDNNYVFILIIL